VCPQPVSVTANMTERAALENMRLSLWG